jgi:hypothetical protein
MCTFVYLQTARYFPLRPIGDVTDAEIHQAADVDIMELHKRMRTQRGAERIPVISELLTCLAR